jgi:hypothetical protein
MVIWIFVIYRILFNFSYVIVVFQILVQFVYKGNLRIMELVVFA